MSAQKSAESGGDPGLRRLESAAAVDLPQQERPHYLEARDLTVTFPSPDGSIRVLESVSLTLDKGDRVGIVGESGSGKTTLAMAIAQLVPHPGYVEGSVKLDGVELLNRHSGRKMDRFLATHIGLVYQDPMSSLNPAMRIGRQMTEVATLHGGMTKATATAAAISRLTEVGIPSAGRQLERYPYQLSGGMSQRVSIAMGMMNVPGLLIADEPTTALDVTIQAQVMDVLDEVNKAHRTAIILISHDLSLISQNCDRIVVMYAGRIVEEISSSLLLSGGAKHPYTRALFGAVPDMSRPRDERPLEIPGQPPDLGSLPTGCPFHPRCPEAREQCALEMPPLLALSDDHETACWVANRGLREFEKDARR